MTFEQVLSNAEDARLSGNYELAMPSGHGESRWTNTANFRTEIGAKDQTINYNNLPSALKSTNLYNYLFPSTQQTQTQTSYTYEQETNLGFETAKYLSHIQARDPDLNWQCYYSVIPNNEAILITTHAISTDLSGSGSVLLNTNDENENPSVTLNYFGDEEEKYLVNARPLRDGIVRGAPLNYRSRLFDHSRL